MTPQPSQAHASPNSLKPDEAIAPLPSPLLDAKAASKLLGVPATWMLAEARADRIPHVRLGRYVRFDACELDAWWRARARGPWRRTGADPVARRRDAA
jgi:excisionase family DNA binding protein